MIGEPKMDGLFFTEKLHLKWMIFDKHALKRDQTIDSARNLATLKFQLSPPEKNGDSKTCLLRFLFFG